MSPIAGQEARGIVVPRAYGKDSNGDGVAQRRCKGGHDLHPSFPSDLAGPAAHETLLLCGCVVGTEVGILLVRLSPNS